MAKHADLDQAAKDAGYEWEAEGLTVAEKEEALTKAGHELPSSGSASTVTTSESTSLEETIENAEGIEPGNIQRTAVVQSTTEVTPGPEDETSAPNAIGTEVEAPPAHTGRPDVPIAQTLTAGAGEHTPPDPEEFDAEGRPRPADEVDA